MSNLYSRLFRKFGKKLKVSPEVSELLAGDIPIAKLPESFKFHTTPEKAQEIALRFAYTFKNIGLLLEPGMGKTKVALDYMFLENFKDPIVVCPKPLRFVWADEAATHRPELRPYIVATTDFDKELKQYRESGCNVVVVNYNKAVTLSKRLAELNPEAIIVDEGLIKDPTTERTEALTWLSKLSSVRGRVVMSGTLINNSPADMFAPTRFLEPSLVGNSFWNFNKEYAHYVESRGENARKILVAYKRIPEIRSILEATSIVMRKSEWLNLPEKVFHDVEVDMGDSQREMYYDLLQNFVCTLPSGVTVSTDSILTTLIKLVQISNGFVYLPAENEDLSFNIDWDDMFSSEGAGNKKLKVTGKGSRSKKAREVYYFEEQPKLDALVKLLREDLVKERAVVWYNMTGERTLIETRLQQEGIEYLCIFGGDKEIPQKIRAFNTNPRYKLLLCQAKSINYGVTILGTKVEENDEDVEEEAVPALNPEVFNEIFYSLNFSLEVYLQQQDRIHRIGQRNTCHYWRLIAKSPIEDRVVKALDSKLSCNQEMLVDTFKGRKQESTLV